MIFLYCVDSARSVTRPAIWFLCTAGMRGERVLLRHQPRDPGRTAGDGVRGEQEVLRAADGGEDGAAEEQWPPGLHPALRREARRIIQISRLNPLPDLADSFSAGCSESLSVNYESEHVSGYQ